MADFDPQDLLNKPVMLTPDDREMSHNLCQMLQTIHRTSPPGNGIVAALVLESPEDALTLSIVLAAGLEALDT